MCEQTIDRCTKRLGNAGQVEGLDADEQSLLVHSRGRSSRRHGLARQGGVRCISRTRAPAGLLFDLDDEILRVLRWLGVVFILEQVPQRLVDLERRADFATRGAVAH
jgi:hypothetical protein